MGSTLTLESLAGQIAALEARVVAVETSKTAPAASSTGVATDEEMAHEYADPVVKYGLKEKYFASQPDPFIGTHWSQTTPAYMDATAKYLSACAYMARKGGDEKKAGYKDLDARRARRHAQNMRGAARFGGTSGYGASAKHGMPPEPEDDIPFIVNMTLARGDRP